MPKLLFVATVSDFIRAFLVPFAEHFRSMGWRVDAAANGVSHDAFLAERFDRLWEIPWSRNPQATRNYLHAPRKIRELVIRERYQIIHVHTPVAGFVTRYALRHVRNPALKVAYTAHGFHFYKRGPVLSNFLFKHLEILAGNWTDMLVVINHEDLVAVNRNKIVDSKRVTYIPGIGVDPEHFSPNGLEAQEKDKVRRSLGFADHEKLFLVIGELSPRKRPLDCLRAFAQLECANCHVAFAGEGQLRASLVRAAGELGISKNVHFLGHTNDVRALLGVSAATVLASSQEGLPRSVMESLSMQVPVIGTSIRGTQELLEEGCGVLYPVGQVDSLAKAMKWVIEHPDESKRMALLGRQKVVQRYALDLVLKRHELIYKDLLMPKSVTRSTCGP